MKYLAPVKARGLVVVAGTVLLALAVAAGASARVHVHRRHVEVRPPSAGAELVLGTHGGYRISVVLEEPDLAMLIARKVDPSRFGVEETRYGAHFGGSLLGGRVTAGFGRVGSIAVRFRRRATISEPHPPEGCEGRPPQRESGRWTGNVALRGEGHYFAVATSSAAGERSRAFRLRCQVKRPFPQARPESLRQTIEPSLGSSLVALLLGTVSSLEAASKEGGRVVEMRAAHATGRGPGAEVEAGAFEYQGRMPVGRFVQILSAPPGSLVTTLPGERPAIATLRPGAPFSGEATYLASSPADHSWTGSLAVRFPGLVSPLAGPSFLSSLCVVSPLVKRFGCESQLPDLQGGEEPMTTRARR